MSALELKTIRLRLVEEADAEFILGLRQDPAYNKHLSAVDSDVEKQRAWIRSYKADESAGNQFYFIIERLDGKPCGTVRIYDLRADSFCWGSWILNQDKTRYAAIESALLVYKYAFGTLNFKKSHFDVRKENTGVISFHERMGAKRINETELDILFELDIEDVKQFSAVISEKFGMVDVLNG